jgi:hypothetical protein
MNQPFFVHFLSAFDALSLVFPTASRHPPRFSSPRISGIVNQDQHSPGAGVEISGLKVTHNDRFRFDPPWGDWRTDTHIAYIKDPALLSTKLKYPGIKNVERIEFIPNT